MSAHPNTQLRLEAPVRQSDGMGGHRVIWEPQGWIWAEMRSGAGREVLAEAGPRAIVGWRIITRAAPMGDARRPAPGQRLRLGPRLFRITAVAEADRHGLWLTCFATEEEPT